MGDFSLSGGVEVTGFISPTDTTDTYPVIDTLYGIDGLRNVDNLTQLNSIPNERRRPGMLVGVSGGTQYYKLNPSPWSGTTDDWTIFTAGGESCPQTFEEPKIGLEKKFGLPDPKILVVDGENCQQYYKADISLTGSCYDMIIGTQDGTNLDASAPPPAGTYIIIVEYNDVGVCLNTDVRGVLWPGDVQPIFTNTNGTRDIITVVSDGITARAVATLGYTS